MVMAVDHTKSSKWDPVYEGPYEVVEQHRGGAYTLKDLTGEIMSTKRTIDMLKVIPSLPMAVPSGEGESDNVNNSDSGVSVTNQRTEQNHFQVENILKHKLDKKTNNYVYFVKWLGFNEVENSWVNAEDFNDVNVIKKYWKSKRKPRNGKKRRRKKL